MQEVTLLVLAWSILPSAFVQEPERQDGIHDKPVLSAGLVDYWGTKKQASIARKSPSSPDATVWAEPVRMPDGRFAVYVPAPQVLRFLDDPTPETVKGYLQWQKERITKLRRAMEVLEAATQESEVGGGSTHSVNGDPPEGSAPVKVPSSDVKPKDSPTVVTYFRRDGCVYCDRQDPILEAVRTKRPELEFRKATPGDSPELWLRHAIVVTPSLVIETAGKPPVILRGLASEETILKAIHGRGADAGK